MSETLAHIATALRLRVSGEVGELLQEFAGEVEELGRYREEGPDGIDKAQAALQEIGRRAMDAAAPMTFEPDQLKLLKGKIWAEPRVSCIPVEAARIECAKSILRDRIRVVLCLPAFSLWPQ